MKTVDYYNTRIEALKAKIKSLNVEKRITMLRERERTLKSQTGQGWVLIWRIIKKTWKFIVRTVVFFSALFACIHYWPEIQQKLQSLFPR